MLQQKGYSSKNGVQKKTAEPARLGSAKQVQKFHLAGLTCR